jgi:nucleoside-diphosphate-sugar epimerase
MRRIPDTSKIHRALGWSPTRSLEDTLSDVIAFERTKAVA